MSAFNTNDKMMEADKRLSLQGWSRVTLEKKLPNCKDACIDGHHVHYQSSSDVMYSMDDVKKHYQNGLMHHTLFPCYFTFTIETDSEKTEESDNNIETTNSLTKDAEHSDQPKKDKTLTPLFDVNSKDKNASSVTEKPRIQVTLSSPPVKEIVACNSSITVNTDDNNLDCGDVEISESPDDPPTINKNRKRKADSMAENGLSKEADHESCCPPAKLYRVETTDDEVILIDNFEESSAPNTIKTIPNISQSVSGVTPTTTVAAEKNTTSTVAAEKNTTRTVAPEKNITSTEAAENNVNSSSAVKAHNGLNTVDTDGESGKSETTNRKKAQVHDGAVLEEVGLLIAIKRRVSWFRPCSPDCQVSLKSELHPCFMCQVLWHSECAKKDSTGLFVNHSRFYCPNCLRLDKFRSTRRMAMAIRMEQELSKTTNSKLLQKPQNPSNQPAPRINLVNATNTASTTPVAALAAKNRPILTQITKQQDPKANKPASVFVKTPPRAFHFRLRNSAVKKTSTNNMILLTLPEVSGLNEILNLPTCYLRANKQRYEVKPPNVGYIDKFFHILLPVPPPLHENNLLIVSLFDSVQASVMDDKIKISKYTLDILEIEKTKKSLLAKANLVLKPIIHNTPTIAPLPTSNIARSNNSQFRKRVETSLMTQKLALPWTCQNSFKILDPILDHLTTRDVLNCRLICKAWKRIVDTHSFWSRMSLSHNNCQVNRDMGKFLYRRNCRQLDLECGTSVAMPKLLDFSRSLCDSITMLTLDFFTFGLDNPKKTFPLTSLLRNLECLTVLKVTASAWLQLTDPDIEEGHTINSCLRFLVLEDIGNPVSIFRYPSFSLPNLKKLAVGDASHISSMGDFLLDQIEELGIVFSSKVDIKDFSWVALLSKLRRVRINGPIVDQKLVNLISSFSVLKSLNSITISTVRPNKNEAHWNEKLCNSFPDQLNDISWAISSSTETDENGDIIVSKETPKSDATNDNTTQPVTSNGTDSATNDDDALENNPNFITFHNLSEHIKKKYPKTSVTVVDMDESL